MTAVEVITAEVHTPIVEIRLLRDEAATQGLATALAASFKALAKRDAIIELHGNLGAGKTTFTRYLLKALGVQGRIKSPTYAVVEPHQGLDGLDISHFDFYRFNDPREWEDAGLRDLYASPGLKIAEWPEQAAGLLPQADLQIELKALEDERREMNIKALTKTGEALLQGLES